MRLQNKKILHHPSIKISKRTFVLYILCYRLLYPIGVFSNTGFMNLIVDVSSSPCVCDTCNKIIYSRYRC